MADVDENELKMLISGENGWLRKYVYDVKWVVYRNRFRACTFKKYVYIMLCENG